MPASRTVNFLLLLLLYFVSSWSITITINVDSTYQTITGWEASTYCKNLPGHSPAFPKYMDKLLDSTVNDLGINRVRLGLGCGIENTEDYFSQWLNGQITEYEFMHDPGNSGKPVNDNNDPFVADTNGFHFSGLDRSIEYVVLPMKQLLQANGEDLYINLTYESFMQSTFEHADYPEEYAEFILVTYQHMQSKYGFVPDAVNIILEPDNCPEWNGQRIGQAIVTTANRLKANGFIPRFIAPSTTNMGNASIYFDAIIQVPDALQYVKEISYHRYGGVSDANLQAIVDRAMQNGINTAMLEHMGSPYKNLHQDLKMGRNTAWSGAYGIAGAKPTHDFYHIDDSDTNNPVIIMNSETKFYRQYFKFIRPDAVRIGAKSDNGNFDPLAFINKDGKYVVVVKAISGGNFTIKGLPSGDYSIKYTTANEYDKDFADQSISAGDSIATSIPQAGVLTVYQKIGTNINKKLSKHHVMEPLYWDIHSNPSRNNVTVSFNNSALVKSVIIFDVKSRKISEWLIPISHQLIWSTKNMPSGMYIISVDFGNKYMSKKIVLMK
jgi:hypothetical protein